MALRSPLTVQPYDYIGDSNGRPLDKGQIYIGVANQDPEFNQIPVYLDAEMTKLIDQPIRTNDGFVDFAGSLQELYTLPEVYSVKVLDKQGRKVLYKGDMTRKNLMSDALAELTQAVDETMAITTESINTIRYYAEYIDNVAEGKDGTDATIDFLPVETGAAGTPVVSVVSGTPSARTIALTIPKGDKGADGKSAYQSALDNGFVGTEAEWKLYLKSDGSIQALQQFMTNPAATDVTVPDYGNIPSLQGYISTMFQNGGLAATPFATKALMTASALANDKYAMVTDDTINNGLYVKTAGAWVKSVYDPVMSAKAYADSNPMFKPINITTAINLNTITTPTLATVTNPTNITLALNFPVAGVGGIGTLEVLQGGFSATVFQKYTLIDGNVYVRGYPNGSWSAWVNQSALNKALAESNRSKVFTLESFNNKAFDISTNLLNITDVGKSVDTDGSIITDTARWLGDYIPYKAGDVFSMSVGSYRVAYYDKNKTFTARGGSTTGNLIINAGVPSGYIRLSSTTDLLPTMRVNTGSTLLPYEPYYLRLKNHDLPRKIVPNDTLFFNISKNLFDKDAALKTKSIDTAGLVIDDPLRWLGDYIPCVANEVFNIPDSSYRLAYYDKNKTFLYRTGKAIVGATEGANATLTTHNDPLVGFVRLSGTYNIDKMQVSRGAALYPYQKFGETKLDAEYLPSNIDIDTTALKAEILSEISVSNYEPSVPTLSFTEVEQTWREPMWLSADGVIMYGGIGAKLLQSNDDWVTKVQIGGADLPKQISGVRVLEDGELLVATLRDDAAAVKSKVYKTIGYDRNNPSAATFKEVLTIGSSKANVTNRWGMSVYQNIAVVGEYGLRDADGAKNAYLSVDNGDTFTLIFNQHTVVAEGRPALTSSAHLHTVAYDPYYNRIWICCGDNPNTATYYSDDLGVTWKFVTGSDTMQYTGIQALPDCVIFGSDRAPNGVHVYRRNGKAAIPTIKELLTVNDAVGITHVFGLPFKKDWLPTTPTYFAGDFATDTSGNSVIVATVDGKKANIIHNYPTGTVLFSVIGTTASGKIIAVTQTSTSSGFVISTADAPTWSKV